MKIRKIDSMDILPSSGVKIDSSRECAILDQFKFDLVDHLPSISEQMAAVNQKFAGDSAKLEKARVKLTSIVNGVLWDLVTE